jgi:hypothetical protein
MEMSGLFHTIFAIQPGTGPPQYLLHKKLGGFQNWARHCDKEKNLCPCQELNHDSMNKNTPSRSTDLFLNLSFI